MIAFEDCIVIINNDQRWMKTVYDDGTDTFARPGSRPEDYERAYDLGYDGDTWAMTVAHELLHTATAVMMGEPHSRILWNVAHGGGKHWPEGGRDEEGRILALAKWLNTGEFDDPYDLLTQFLQQCVDRLGIGPEVVRERAKHLIRLARSL